MRKAEVKKLVVRVAFLIDILFLPLVFFSGIVLWAYRRVGSKNMPKSTRLLKNIGIFPIRKHYYEPLFDERELKRSLRHERELPGICFDLDRQRAFLAALTYQSDFENFMKNQIDCDSDCRFSLSNGSFEFEDAEFLFNFVRHIKPARVYEVGCGNSTKLISAALQMNEAIDGVNFKHTCIEPYEQPWLESLARVEVKRSRLEEIDIDWAIELKAGDFLFIDSSHVLRPQGDVVQEYLKIIPTLKSGVYIHVHDIFTPRDYLDEWIKEKVLFWNEQYILEATLSGNKRYEIVAALNFLKHSAYDDLLAVCPSLTKDEEPGSFYFKVS